jgi:hypothetical protein
VTNPTATRSAVIETIGIVGLASFAASPEDVDPVGDQAPRQFRQPTGLIAGILLLDDHVLALEISEVPEPASERGDEWMRSCREPTDAVDACPWLCPGGKRHGYHPTNKHRHEPSPPHRELNYPAFLIRSRSLRRAGIALFKSFHCSLVQCS